MLWSTTPIHTPAGKRLYLRYIALRQPNWPKGVLRASLSKEQFGPAAEQSMFLCSQDANGDWIAIGDAPNLRDANYHPDLSDNENEFIAIAREVIKTLGPEAYISVGLDTQQDSDYKQRRIGTVFFIRPGGVDERALNLIPGVRALEQDAYRFWDTVGATFFDDGGLEGEFTFEIHPESMMLSYQTTFPEEVLTFVSRFENGIWTHGTELVLSPDDPVNVVEEMKQLRDGPIRILNDRFPQTKFATAFSAEDVCEGHLLEHEVENGQHTIELCPGSLRRLR